MRVLLRPLLFQALLVFSAAVFVAPDFPDSRLNPVEYAIANALPGHSIRDFGDAEFFEVDSPSWKSRYGSVFWDVLPSVNLSAALVARFDGRVLAVTGFEVAVLRRKAAGEEPVPCYQSYNHHYVASLHGKGASLRVRRPLERGR